jgi:HEAT repeat protein/nucleoside phosphorylase
VEEVSHTPLEAALGESRRGLAPFYLPPTLRGIDAGVIEEGSAERLGIDALAERLHSQDDHGPRATFFVAGAPGGGKTTLARQLEVRLLAASCPCVLVNAARLENLGAVPGDERDLVVRLRPNLVSEERWWRAQAKKGRVAVLVDAWNEIQRRHGDDRALMRLLRALLFGNHRFNVLVTSRDDLDDDGGTLRTPLRYVLEPFSSDEIEAFLKHWQIDLDEGMRAIRASGLEFTASNPFLLSLVVGLLRDAPGQALPRTRAGLFERTLVEAGRRLAPAEKRPREEGLDLGAVLGAAAVLSLVSGTLTLPRLDLAKVLRGVWAQQPVDIVIDALADKHLATRRPGPFGETLALTHESLRDFGLALAYRDRPVPAWAYLPGQGEQVLADWVGLQADPGAAARAAVPTATDRRRFDLLVDVLTANGSALPEATREMLWSTVGEGLTYGRAIASRICERLALLPRSTAREALRDGVLRPMARAFPETHAVLREALLGQRLDAVQLQRILRARSRGQLAANRNRSGKHTSAGAAAASSAQVERMTQTLRSHPSAARRRVVANQLGEVGAGLTELVEAMQTDAAAEVRGAAANALGKLRHAAAVEALIKTLEDGDAVVRGSAANALGAIGDKAAVQAVIHTLASDEDHRSRGSAANALGAIGDKAAVQALIHTLASDEDPKSRGSAANALGAIGDKAAVQALLEALVDGNAVVRGSAANALGAIGDKAAVPALIHTLASDQDPKNRGAAATALGAIGDKAAVQALIHTLASDGAPDARGSAATALGAIGDEAAVPALIHALASDEDPKNRGAAATALGAIGDKAAVPALIRTLASDEDPKSRGSAANALGAIGDKAAVPAQIKALELDGDVFVRGTVARAMGTIGDPAAAPVLRSLIERHDEAARVKVTAVSSLVALAPDAPVWLLSVAQRPGLELAKEVRGRIAAAIAAAPASAAGAAWLKHLVWRDGYGASRTEAVRGLAAQGALDDETVRFVLDPAFSSPSHNVKAPDIAVRGQLAAALIRARAESSPLGLRCFALAVRHLAASDTPPTVIGAALFPLETLPLTQVQVVLQAFDQLLAKVPAPSPALLSRLEKYRERVAFETQAQAELGALAGAPETPLRSFRSRVPTLLGKETFMTAPATTNPIALLMTAVGAERRALLELLREDAKVAPSLEEVGGRYFDRFPWRGRGRTWDVFLGQATEKGPHAAQALLQDFVRSHALELVLMVGMCGGLPEHGAKEGGVLLARQVFNYEPARLRDGTAAWSPMGYRSTPRLLDLANALASRGDFGDIKVQATKDYGSGEKLIDDLASDLRQKILAFSGDIVGFEMEGHGMLHAVWELQRNTHFEAGITKGVADFGDGEQQHDKDARQRVATRNAAQVALKLLAEY